MDPARATLLGVGNGGVAGSRWRGPSKLCGATFWRAIGYSTDATLHRRESYRVLTTVVCRCDEAVPGISRTVYLALPCLCENYSDMRIDRRNLLCAAAALTMVQGLPGLALAAGQPPVMSAPEALEAATRGEVVLVDIRSREEWQQTGVAEPALPISMHEGGFVEKLIQAMGGDRNRKVALICATGGRTRYVQHVLSGSGFTNIIDVSEGMMGSPAGPGWLKRGLPVKRWKP